MLHTCMISVFPLLSLILSLYIYMSKESELMCRTPVHYEGRIHLMCMPTCAIIGSSSCTFCAGCAISCWSQWKGFIGIVCTLSLVEIGFTIGRQGALEQWQLWVIMVGKSASSSTSSMQQANKMAELNGGTDGLSACVLHSDGWQAWWDEGPCAYHSGCKFVALGSLPLNTQSFQDLLCPARAKTCGRFNHCCCYCYIYIYPYIHIHILYI